MEPNQFVDPNVYLWNISNNGELMKLEGVTVPPLHRNAHCADYATIRQQVGGPVLDPLVSTHCFPHDYNSGVS